jgi:hypothetical protein
VDTTPARFHLTRLALSDRPSAGESSLGSLVVKIRRALIRRGACTLAVWPRSFPCHRVSLRSCSLRVRRSGYVDGLIRPLPFPAFRTEASRHLPY